MQATCTRVEARGNLCCAYKVGEDCAAFVVDLELIRYHGWMCACCVLCVCVCAEGLRFCAKKIISVTKRFTLPYPFQNNSYCLHLHTSRKRSLLNSEVRVHLFKTPIVDFSFTVLIEKACQHGTSIGIVALVTIIER